MLRFVCCIHKKLSSFNNYFLYLGRESNYLMRFVEFLMHILFKLVVTKDAFKKLTSPSYCLKTVIIKFLHIHFRVQLPVISQTKIERKWKKESVVVVFSSGQFSGLICESVSFRFVFKERSGVQLLVRLSLPPFLPRTSSAYHTPRLRQLVMWVTLEILLPLGSVSLYIFFELNINYDES